LLIFSLFFTTEPDFWPIRWCKDSSVYSQLKRIANGQTDRQTDGKAISKAGSLIRKLDDKMDSALKICVYISVASQWSYWYFRPN